MLFKPNFDFTELENTATNFNLALIFILKRDDLRVGSGRCGKLVTGALVTTVLCLTVTQLNFEVSFHRRLSSNLFYFIASKINDAMRPS